MDQNSTQRVIKISRTKLFLIITALILLALFILFALGITRRTYRPAPGSSIPTVQQINNSAIPYIDSSNKTAESIEYPGRYNSGTADITDTREFLKTNYSSTIKTRDVQEVVTDVKNIVKGADGRIDNMTSSEKYGYVSFVVAKDKFDDFKDEIQALTHAKLYFETISTTNKLTTKQSIEGDIANANTSLESLNNELAALTKKHSQTLASLNAELTRIQAELAKVRNNLWNITDDTDEVTLASWRTQETSYVNQEAAQKQRIYSENSTYNTQKTNLDKRISSQKAYLASAQGRDVAFTNDIETVNGTVNVQWVSIWQLMNIFLPISPVWIIIILIIAIFWFLHHKKITPKIVIG